MLCDQCQMKVDKLKGLKLHPGKAWEVVAVVQTKNLKCCSSKRISIFLKILGYIFGKISTMSATIFYEITAYREIIVLYLTSLN